MYRHVLLKINRVRQKKAAQKPNQGNRQSSLHINITDVDGVKRFDMLKSGRIRVLPATSILKKKKRKIWFFFHNPAIAAGADAADC